MWKIKVHRLELSNKMPCIDFYKYICGEGSFQRLPQRFMWVLLILHHWDPEKGSDNPSCLGGKIRNFGLLSWPIGGIKHIMFYKGNRQITTMPVSLCYDFWARSGIQSPLSPWIPIFGGWLFSCNLCAMENCTAKNINIRPRVNLPPNILRSVDFWVRKWVKRARFSSVCRASFPLPSARHATTQDSEMYTP